MAHVSGASGYQPARNRGADEKFAKSYTVSKTNVKAAAFICRDNEYPESISNGYNKS